MNAGELVNAIEKFFLDIIGTLLPGATLIMGVFYIFKPELNLLGTIASQSVEKSFLFFAGASFICGHALTSLGYVRVINFIEKYANNIIIKKLIPVVESDAELSSKLSKDPTFFAFREILDEKIPILKRKMPDSTSLREWRNIAMSIVPEQSQVVYRFAFISIFSLSVSTALMLLIFIWISAGILQLCSVNIVVRPTNIYIILSAMFISVLLLERYYSFKRRSLKVPFAMALIKMAQGEGFSEPFASNDKVSKMSEIRCANRFCIYLAGGFRSGWQDVVKSRVPNEDYLDPRSHGLIRSEEYTSWDLAAIRNSDIVFACLESSNPGGYALALEIGYANARGKFVILVDEKSQTDPEIAGRLLMIHNASNVVFNTLEGGIKFLEKYCEAK